MNDKIKRFTFYNIFFLCAFIGMFMVLKLYSFASDNDIVVTTSNNVDTEIVSTFYLPKNYRYCIYVRSDNSWILYGTYKGNINVNQVWYRDNRYGNSDFTFNYGSDTGVYNKYYYLDPSGASYGKNVSVSRGQLYKFSDLSAVYNYLDNGIVPNLPFDETLKLDSFKVTSWQIGTSQLVFRSKFEVTWSDSRISNVQVKIVGTANSPVSFEANVSPFKQKFYASNYVMKNGDIIHLTATPFKANGEYGESLYYSIVYEDGLPSNWYRKLVNTPYNDNTLTIPYTDVSSQPQSVTLPVDGVTTNKVYKVNYNPVTYEYGDLNLYEIYYSPVVVYPDNTTEEEIDETQDVVTNVYTTNNYNTINNNTNYEFNINFGDISNNDIQDSYDDVGNFINGFGSFLGKIVNFFGVLFPFFPIGVSIAIITAFGIVALLLIVALVIKIISAIKNFLF